MTNPNDLFSRARAVGAWRRFVDFPVARIVVAVLFLIPAILLHNLIFNTAKGTLDENTFNWFRDVEWIVSVALIFISYRIYTRVVEKRSAGELSSRGAIKETGTGLALGAGLVILAVAVMYIANCYRIESTGGWESFVHLFREFGAFTFSEELIFRLILFRLLEELIGSVWALIGAAVVFGIAHAGNPSSTAWTTISLTVLGCLFIGCFMLSRRIWMAWGTHFGWNYFQTAVFGMANSGRADHITFVNPAISGPEWLTGGDFGIEASWLAFTLLALSTVAVIRAAARRGHVVKPRWLRTTEATPAP
ncbi:MAG: CPBP family intramembrane metalloprotease [Candidatus Zixiibacteriota bacterium]|nr:MAG: CPBP family intramembrane metalloprotease [candidate division Zixibacteria bacterium]